MSSPGHAVDAHRAGKTIRIEVDGEMVAESSDAIALEETGMRTRWYLPRDDVRAGILRPSDFHSHCPFKGEASYHHVLTGVREHEDLVWYYPEPLDAVAAIRDRVCFYNEKVAVFVDGQPEE
jgi:uncharacterized protein (DUF427 family)